ncbi:cupin domain-containing protein [bacterium]|nr:cupin domain-containing protein [bacterium]
MDSESALNIKFDAEDTVLATYRLRCTESEAATLARQIALEQTVEVPEDLLAAAPNSAQLVGQIVSVSADPSSPAHQLVQIQYPAHLAGTHVGQLWNLLFGNISLKRHIRLTRLDFSPQSLVQFAGPRYGIEGLRSQLGVFQRPLLGTALKPRGSSNEELAELAYQFAMGGGDFVKDDHNLVDDTFEAFGARVDACQQAVERAEQHTGRRCLYAPNLSAPLRQLDRYVEFLLQRGIAAALIAPMLLGFDTTHDLTRRYPLFWMAHPSLTGCFFHDADHGVDPAVLLGQFLRLIGCDATIFPNHGGRFTFTPEECRAIAQAATEPTPGLKPSWPTPAGGMSFDRIDEMSSAYGADAILLIGGALLSDSQSLAESTRRFRERIEQQFSGTVTQPPQPTGFVSACELPASSGRPSTTPNVLTRLAFQAGFAWDGRSATAYKLNGSLPFAGVSRTELIGMHGEQTAFDVRYFEIAPGGYSSLEKHGHTHVIIGVRGAGVLKLPQETLPVNAFDIAYVPPLEVHQLRNESAEPFGFLCIVDHERDRPQAP